MPLFSIITVVYNGEALLAGTMESVRRQGFQDYEYLVVDGASKDGSLDIVRSFSENFPQLRWVSEPDRGLYDAMNKGLRLAAGDFVLFLNAGDQFHDDQVLSACAALATDNTDVLYGETMLVDAERRPAGLMSEWSTRKTPQHLHWRQYLGGMLVVHQSFFARRSLAPPYISDNLCADFDWCIEILKKSRSNVYTGLIISDYLMGGMSKKRHRQSLKDRFAVMRKHYGLLPALLSHLLIVIRAVGHRISRAGKGRY